MTRTEFLREFDKILELPEGNLKGSETLENLENWNSLAMVDFIALADNNNGVKLSARQIGQSETVADLLKLAKVES
jgi:acyl carrier protein